VNGPDQYGFRAVDKLEDIIRVGLGLNQGVTEIAETIRREMLEPMSELLPDSCPYDCDYCRDDGGVVEWGANDPSRPRRSP
jgi:hypothetical protein